MGKKKQNLQGYKRQGKRFIPPMKQLPMMREHSYVRDMLPELIWLGLIHDRVGYRFGVRTLELVVEVTKDLPASQRRFNCALQVSYADLSDQTKTSIIRRWAEEDMLETIRDAVSPLVLLYDGCPLAFVGPPSNVLSEEVLVKRITESVANHLDRTETPGAVLHGSLLLTRLIAGTIKFGPQIDIPNFDAVINDPESDDARRAASFMRASASAEWGMQNVPNDWARYFWNRNAALSACELPDGLNYDV